MQKTKGHRFSTQRTNARAQSIEHLFPNCLDKIIRDKTIRVPKDTFKMIELADDDDNDERSIFMSSKGMKNFDNRMYSLNKGYMPHLWSQRKHSDDPKSRTGVGFFKPKSNNIVFHRFDCSQDGRDLELNSNGSPTNSIRNQQTIEERGKFHSETLRKLNNLISTNRKQRDLLTTGLDKSSMQLATELDRRRDKERIRQTKIFQRTAIYDNNRYMLKPSNTNSKLSKRLTIMRTSPEENRANNLLKTVGGEVNMSQALFSKMRSKVVNVDYQPMFIQGVKPLTREAATLSLIKDNRFVLFGGFVYDRKEIAYEFDIKSRVWTNIQYPENYPLLACHSAGSIGSSVVIFGGRILSQKPEFEPPVMNLNRELIIYKRGQGWDRYDADSRVEARLHHCSIFLNNDLLVFGGMNKNFRKLNDFWFVKMGNKFSQIDKGISGKGQFGRRGLLWQRLSITKESEFPKLSNHTMCLAIHSDFQLHPGGGLEYTKMCTTDKQFKQRNKKLESSGIYIYGGITEQNFISDDLYIVRLDQIPHQWRRAIVKGVPPPPLYDHQCNYITEGDSLVISGGRNDLNSHILGAPRSINYIPGISALLYVLDLNYMEWNTVKIINNPDRTITAHSASSDGGSSLYIFGGVNGTGCLDNNLYRMRVRLTPEQLKAKSKIGVIRMMTRLGITSLRNKTFL